MQPVQGLCTCGRSVWFCSGPVATSRRTGLHASLIGTQRGTQAGTSTGPHPCRGTGSGSGSGPRGGCHIGSARPKRGSQSGGQTHRSGRCAPWQAGSRHVKAPRRSAKCRASLSPCRPASATRWRDHPLDGRPPDRRPVWPGRTGHHNQRPRLSPPASGRPTGGRATAVDRGPSRGAPLRWPPVRSAYPRDSTL